MALKYAQEFTASLGVTDLARSIEWYRSVLGFTVKGDFTAQGFCELKTHLPEVVVVLAQVETVAQGGGATGVWTVTDIQAAKAHLDALDVRQDGGILEIPDTVKLLTFFDPDGNPSMFAEVIARD